MSLLVAQNLELSINRQVILKSISLQVNPGEIVGLLGPNGAGKTSCFYALTGLTRLTQGQVFLNQQDITHLPLCDRAHLGLSYLPQEPSIFRGLTVANNLKAALELTKLTPDEQNIKQQQLIQQFHLQHCAHTLGAALSGGERRRAEIARALTPEPQPKIILLDEPFAGIDPRSIYETKQLIQQLAQQGIAILMTDHNARDTLGICERIYILAQGSVLAHGTPKEMIQNDEVRQVYLGEHF
jgi:lipopolysaccharide export system ATP-binding protein